MKCIINTFLNPKANDRLSVSLSLEVVITVDAYFCQQWSRGPFSFELNNLSFLLSMFLQIIIIY